MKQRKKRNKKYTAPKAKPATLKARCKICKTLCTKDSSDTFLKWKAENEPNYPYDFVFAPNCECYEHEDEWMEIV